MLRIMTVARRPSERSLSLSCLFNLLMYLFHAMYYCKCGERLRQPLFVSSKRTALC